MTKVVETMKNTVDKIIDGIRPKIYTRDQAHQIAMSGISESAESRLKEKIKYTEYDLKKIADAGELCMLCHFKDAIIRSVMDEFVKYFVDKGFEVKTFKDQNAVLILW